MGNISLFKAQTFPVMDKKTKHKLFAKFQFKENNCENY